DGSVIGDGASASRDLKYILREGGSSCRSRRDIHQIRSEERCGRETADTEGPGTIRAEMQVSEVVLILAVCSDGCTAQNGSAASGSRAGTWNRRGSSEYRGVGGDACACDIARVGKVEVETCGIEYKYLADRRLRCVLRTQVGDKVDA